MHYCGKGVRFGYALFRKGPVVGNVKKQDKDQHGAWYRARTCQLPEQAMHDMPLLAIWGGGWLTRFVSHFTALAALELRFTGFRG